MLPEERDNAYVWDMLQAAKELLEMNRDVNFEDFIDDLKLMRATERSLEIIGEAARRLSSSFMDQHREVHWREIVGQRNIIAHEYGQIDYEILYRTVRDDIPLLIQQLEKILPKEGL